MVDSLRRVVGNDKWAEISVPDESDSDPGKIEHNPSRRHLFRRFVGRGADQLTRPVSAGEAQPVPLKAIRFAAPFSTAGRELLQILFNTPGGTPTPLPTNPAIVSRADVLTTVGTGVGIGAGILLLFGAFLGTRQWLRSRK